MSTWKHDSVFHDGEANDAFALRFISQIGCSVILAENVVQLKDGLVIKKFLLDKLESE